MTHPEDTALRLAEAATEGPWAADQHRIYVVGQDGRPAGGMSVGMWPTVGQGYREDDAAHIAHAHPGRVRAWLGAVARLRERVAEGHSSECVKRFRPAMDCKCGHEDDLAALVAVDAEG
jgi:hypothetical protein